MTSDLRKTILSDSQLARLHELAMAELGTGLTAGTVYPEVWIRDLNTFLEPAVRVAPRDALRTGLLTFLDFQQEDGQVVDGYAPAESSLAAYEPYLSPRHPGLKAHKNDVEADQESSLVQAVAAYVRVTGDWAFLHERVDGVAVVERLEGALEFLFDQRWAAEYGLLWNATTADWGDIQPEHAWGVRLSGDSHRAASIYTNAMAVIAITDLRCLLGDGARAPLWAQREALLRENIRGHLWDADRRKFVPHRYLSEGSPFPPAFDENLIWYHGGTAIAALADLLSPAEVAAAYRRMVHNVEQAGARSVGLTLYPCYPRGYFKNPDMAPYHYQNGGDWPWFGGRMVQALVRHGLLAEAYAALKPMAAMTLEHGGFYEWYDRDGDPHGAGHFRGGAGVLAVAVERLRAAVG